MQIFPNISPRVNGGRVAAKTRRRRRRLSADMGDETPEEEASCLDGCQKKPSDQEEAPVGLSPIVLCGGGSFKGEKKRPENYRDL